MIKNRKIVVSVVSLLLVFSFIFEISPTTVQAKRRSERTATRASVTAPGQDTTTEQEDGLEYQTISSFPEKSKDKVVTLDGLMPVNAEVSVQSSQEHNKNNLFAYDISITDQNGEEFQPMSDEPITVEITNTVIGKAQRAKKKLRLWHIDDNGLREEVKDFTLDNDKIIFEASSFSVYEVDDGNTPLRTYKFLMPGNPQNNTNYSPYYYPTSSQDDGGDYKKICSQTIKNGEKLIFPQLPADIGSKYTFVGWFVGSGGTPGDQKLDFDNVPAVTQTETIELYACFDSCVYAIFHEQYNGRTETFPVFATRRGRIVSNNGHMEATFYFDDLKVIYDDDEKEEGAPPSMQFKGWTTTRIKSYPATESYTLLTSPCTFSIAEDSDDKSIRLYPVFEPIRWLEFDSNGLGATYIPPKSFPKDEGFTFSGMPVPIREGYVFNGWYTEKTGGTLVADAHNQLNTSLDTTDMEVRNGRLYLKGDTLQVELHAHWTPGNSKYTVIIWRQKESDDKSAADAAKTYDYAESETINATTGDSVSVANEYKNKERNGDYTGFYYSRCDAAKDVAGDGSTVLNVYYDRCKVVYGFYYSNNNNAHLYTWIGLYGQKITKYGYTWESASAWYYRRSSNNGITYLESFNSIDDAYSYYNSESHTYTTNMYRNGTNSSYQIIHVLQDLNGNYDLNNTDLVYYTNASYGYSTFNFTNKFEGFTVYGYSHKSFTANPSNNALDSNEQAEAGKDKSVSLNYQDLYVYHKRNTWTLTFNDSVDAGTVYDTVTVKYQEPLSSHRPTTNPTTPSTRPGYEFTDWYFDQSCGAVADFSNMTMPNANMIVYAGWETIWFRIEIDPNGGQLSSTQSTFFWEPYNGDPIEEYKTISRNYEPDVNGSYYYALYNRAHYNLGDDWDPIEDTISVPDRGAFYTDDITLATSSTRYRFAQGAYRYLGWYEVNPVTGAETPYNFGTRVVHDTYLRMHWKQLGTYHIKYDAGEGTIDGYDMNEVTFEFLDAYDYADHAEVVVTRVAKPVDGKNFVGWRMKHDPSGRVYYPGQTFQFSSAYAESITQVDENTGAVDVKRTIIMEAVYEEIKLAKIIYDANGGTIDNPTAALLPEHAGYQIIASAQFPVNDLDFYHNISVEYSVSTTQLTVSDFLNNSAVRLSDGTGFSNHDYEFLGWSTKRDGSEGFIDKNSITTINRWVDNNEPLILYAQWEVKVYFDRNDLAASNYYWGNGTDNNWASDSKYEYDKGMYYTTIKLNGKVDKPAYTPTSSDSEEMFSNWSLDKQSVSGVMESVFDFANTGITQEMIDNQHNDGNYLVLHACWKAPIKIPVHYVDTSNEGWVLKDSVWLKPDDGGKIILRDSTHVSLAGKANADVYALDDATNGYEYAFAAEQGKGNDDYKNITGIDRITEIWYDVDEMSVKVKYSDNNIYDFDAANNDIYLVYFKSPEYIPIGYDLMNTNGTLSSVPSGSAPTTANVVLEPPYDLQAKITQPINWTKWGNDTDQRYHYYSFAIGKENAQSSADLKVITGYKTDDSDRPVLQVRNNWDGFEYSYDGTNWYSCGYNISLYAIYYEWIPTVVNLREETIALPDKMGTEFNYNISITQTESKTVTRIYYYRIGGGLYGYYYDQIINSSTYPTTSTPSSVTTTVNTTSDLKLSDGQSDSYVVFYTSIADTDTGYIQYYVNGQPQRYRLGQTNYYVYYRDVTSDHSISQTIDINQTQNVEFTTSNDAAVSSDSNVLNSKYTSAGSPDPVTITYTNRQKLEMSVNVAVRNGNSLTAHNNDLRTTNTAIYEHDFTNSAEWDISDPTVISPGALINDNSTYVFTGIVTGTETGGQVTQDQANITTLSFGEIRPGVYGYYLNLDTANPLNNKDIWFVYTQKPTIKYKYEKPDGTFVDITSFMLNNHQFSRTTIANNEVVPVEDTGLLIDVISTFGSSTFLIPDLLDYEGEPLLLDLNRVSVGDSSAITDDSDSKKMEILFADGKMQYRFHDGDTPTPFEENPVIYAVYKLKGYELTLTKKVLGDSSHTHEFTFEISSDQLTHSSYETTIGTHTVTNQTMSITIGRGQSVTIYGLTSGTYTIRETTHGDYTMTAKINGSSQNVTNNTTAVLLTDNTEVEVLNTYPIPVTGAADSAIPYVVVVTILIAAVIWFISRRREGKHYARSFL